jgi:hypothetical protein
VSLPIRVYATDFRGKDFVEDSTTVVVNRHGAKIRLSRQLLPQQEIRILSQRTGEEAVFRVISRVGSPVDRYTFWGVECLSSGHNIWGMGFPEPNGDDQLAVRAMLRCPMCGTREKIYLDEPLLESMSELGGLLRGCSRCGHTAVWEQVPYNEAAS